MTFKVVFIIIV